MKPEDQKQRNRMRLWLWIALTLSIATLALRLLLPSPAQTQPLVPTWILPLLSLFCVSGIVYSDGRPEFLRINRTLIWCALLLTVWVANKLPFDLLNMSGLIRNPATNMAPVVDWTGFLTRSFAFATVIILGRLALARPADVGSDRPALWYGYAAFVLALPYPVIRIIWAFGGMLGLSVPGAGGVGISPLLFAIPWIMAAVLSLLLVSPRQWKSRRFMLVSGWTATAIVAMIGPIAVWTLISGTLQHNLEGPPGMSIWVPCLFYISWFLWAIAAGAATRSYQLRS
jgi:hypothetical protein